MQKKSTFPIPRLCSSLLAPDNLWLLIVGCSFLISLFYAIGTHGAALTNALYMQGNDFILDYSAHIQYVQEPSRVYYGTMHACFPPLAYCLYYLLGLVSPVSFSGENAVMALQSNLNSLLIYTVYLGMLCAWVGALIRRYLNGKPLWRSLLFLFLLFVSNIFVLGLFENGNSAFIVLVLLMAAFIWKDDKSHARREAALFCIAIAAGLKVYPAIFGLFYLKEKRFTEAFRLILYGLFFFFAPFVFFGGVDGFVQFLNHQTSIHLLNPASWTIGTLGGKLASSVAGLLQTTPSDRMLRWAQMFAMGIFALLIGASFFLRKNRPLWGDIILLTCLVVLTPSWSGYYAFSYLLPPMLLFMAQKTPEPQPWRILFTLCFASIFISFAVLPYRTLELVTAISVYTLLILLLAHDLSFTLARRKQKSRLPVTDAA